MVSARTNAAGRLLNRLAPTAPAAADTTITAAGTSRTGPSTSSASQAVTPAVDRPSTRTPIAATKTSDDQPMPSNGPGRRPPSRSTRRRTSQTAESVGPSGTLRIEATVYLMAAAGMASRRVIGISPNDDHESGLGLRTGLTGSLRREIRSRQPRRAPTAPTAAGRRKGT